MAARGQRVSSEFTRRYWRRLDPDMHTLYMHIVSIAPDLDPSLVISDADIRRTVHPSNIVAGRTYEQRGRVQELRIHDQGAIITATTQGSAPDPYAQRVVVSHFVNGLRITGTCTCPVGRHCKHIAAVLIAAQRMQYEIPIAGGFPSVSSTGVTGRAAPEKLPPQIQMWLADFDHEDE